MSSWVFRCFCLCLLTVQLVHADAKKGQWIVFEQLGDHPTALDFQQKTLPKLEALAKQSGIELKRLNVADGAPQEIHLTPLIVYQNHLGRSFYQGRYQDLDRILNFTRRSQFYPQESTPLIKEDIFVQGLGRQVLGAPLKIAPLTGEMPWFYRERSFLDNAEEWVTEGFGLLKLKSSASFGRSDRLFYMDIYPWCDGKTLHLSLALFSQFHCKKPVFERKGDLAIIGPWGERERLFREAGKMLEQAIQSQLSNTDRGDGFQPVVSETSLVTWADLGLALPKGNELKVTQSHKDLSWSTTTFNMAPSMPLSPPQVSFAFPAPLDQYSGQLKQVSGHLSTSTPGVFNGAKGKIVVQCRSVDMGEEDLNEALLDQGFLDVEKFPESYFDFVIKCDDDQPLSFEEQTFANAKGTFFMKGVSVELSLPVTLETVADDSRRVGVMMKTSFVINLNDFKVESADGPSPQNHTLHFDVAVEFY